MDEFYIISDDTPTEEEEAAARVQRKKRTAAKKKKRKKKRFPIGKAVGIAFLLLLLVYMSALVYTSNFTMITTEDVTTYEVSEYMEVSAIAVRNEEYVETTKDGILAYIIDDGGKVNAGGTVAKIFSTEEEVNSWREYNELDEELAILEDINSSSSSTFVDLDNVNSQIQSGIADFRHALVSGSYSNAADYSLTLLQLFNERAVLTDDTYDLSERIAELTEQRDAITVSESIGDVKSDVAGTFVSSVDGYEESFDYDTVTELMPDDLDEIITKSPPSNAVGKVITNINWYLVCEVTSEQAMQLAGGSTEVEISMPNVMSDSVPATIAAVNQQSTADGGVLVLECSYMDSSLASVRNEEITILTNTYTGLKVSRDAVHEDTITVTEYDDDGNAVGTSEETVQGVYVVYNNRLKFVQINIIYSGKDFVLCDSDTTSSELLKGETVALYDEVVVSGKDLYNGKPVG